MLSVCLALSAGCASAPRLVQLPALPPAAAAQDATAWAAFELSLRADGRVATDAVRTLGWEAAGASSQLYFALWRAARASTWAAGDPDDPARRHVVLVLDGAGRAYTSEVPARVRRRLAASLRARARAAAALSAGARGSDLDCIWTTLQALRSGAPFLHDEVEGWRELGPRLGRVEHRDGGFWVCRAARGTHRGQFVFLDAARRVLAVRTYLLGE